MIIYIMEGHKDGLVVKEATPFYVEEGLSLYDLKGSVEGLDSASGYRKKFWRGYIKISDDTLLKDGDIIFRGKTINYRPKWVCENG